MSEAVRAALENSVEGLAESAQKTDAGFLWDFWYPAMRSEEIYGKNLAKAMLLEVPMVLGRTSEGQAFAMRDSCPHRGIPLSYGHFDGKNLQILPVKMPVGKWNAPVRARIPHRERLPLARPSQHHRHFQQHRLRQILPVNLFAPHRWIPEIPQKSCIRLLRALRQPFHRIFQRRPYRFAHLFHPQSFTPSPNRIVVHPLLVGNPH